MSGAMRRMGEYLGLLEDTGHYDDYDETPGDYEPEARAPKPSRRELRESRRETEVADLAERRRPVAVVASSVAELTRITTLQPRTYNDARTVGEHFRDGTPVIMNLTDMDDSDAKRLVDFAAGLVFASHGTIERITQRVFLLSPPNVSVGAEKKARLVEGGFFNQS